jgi:hypothetical protein
MGQVLLVVEHRAEIAHVKPALMGSEIEPCQSDGHGESGSMTHGISSAAHGSMSSGRPRATALRNGIYSLTAAVIVTISKIDGGEADVPSSCGSGLGSNSEA